jgi:hypothetical protein
VSFPDTYQALCKYGWHQIGDYKDTVECPRWADPVPESASQWARLPKRCRCGFYQALHAARENA